MKYFIFLIFIFIFTGCSFNQTQVANANDESKNDVIHQEFPTLIKEISSELISKDLIDSNSSVAMTSFVDLTQLNKTTKFGQIVSESLIRDFNAKKIKVVDFRSQQSVIINASGEFLLSRDADKLKKEFTNSYIVVGTFSNFDGNMIINSRILDFENGNVISTSRAYLKIKNCKLFDDCIKDEPKIIIKTSTINISKD